MAMTLRLPAELDAELDELAAAEGTSKQAIVTDAVVSYLARKGRHAQLDDALAFVLDHDAELLRRLEDA